jgi:hypothetical protein
MGILISWQLVFPSVLILTSFTASHLTLSHLLLDPTLSENRNGKPLPTKVSSIGLFDIFFNICCHRGNAAFEVRFRLL